MDKDIINFTSKDAVRAVCGDTVCKEGEKPHELDEVETADLFLREVCGNIFYWQRLEDKTEKEKLQGLAFSIMAMLDGTQVGLPQFIVAPNPHPDDRRFHIEAGANWFAENFEAEDKANSNVGGMLHERFHQVLHALEKDIKNANLRRNDGPQET